jgi:hypothetical protein
MQQAHCCSTYTLVSCSSTSVAMLLPWYFLKILRNILGGSHRTHSDSKLPKPCCALLQLMAWVQESAVRWPDLCCRRRQRKGSQILLWMLVDPRLLKAFHMFLCTYYYTYIESDVPFGRHLAPFASSHLDNSSSASPPECLNTYPHSIMPLFMSLYTLGPQNTLTLGWPPAWSSDLPYPPRSPAGLPMSAYCKWIISRCTCMILRA